MCFTLICCFRKVEADSEKLFFRFGRVKLTVPILRAFCIHLGMSFQIVFQTFRNILALRNYTDMLWNILPDFG